MDDALANQLNQRLEQFLKIFRAPGEGGGGGNVEDGILLGFQNATTATTVFIGESSGHPWYRLDDSKQVPVVEDAIVGRINGIALKIQPSEKHGDKVKLIVGFDAGSEKVRVQSGVSTWFAKSLLAALLTGSISKDDIVCMQVKLGQEGNVIFPTLTLVKTGAWIKCDSKSIGSEEQAIDAARAAAELLGIKFKGLDDASGGSNPLARASTPAGGSRDGDGDDDPPF